MMIGEGEERKRTVGELLRAERARKKLSLDEVSLKTKISKRLIKCIEENRFSELPSPVSLKGFLKIYSEFLGLDPDPLMKELTEMNVLSGGPRLKLTHSIDNKSAVTPGASWSRYWAYGAAALVALLFIYIVILMAPRPRREALRPAERTVSPVATGEVAPSPAAPAPVAPAPSRTPAPPPAVPR